MIPDWLKDGRKIPDDVMHYIRIMAVHAVRTLNISPTIVSKVYNFSPNCIYRWLKQYDEGGFEALASKTAPGSEPIITTEMDEWLEQMVLSSTPDQFGYDTNLWTCKILADLLEREFDVKANDDTVRIHLKSLELTCQIPEYQDNNRDDFEIEQFKTEKFPMIQRLAIKLDADIAFEDESGVGVMTRHGRTWGRKGQTPVVKVSMQRGGYNVLSAVTVKGEMQYLIKDETINGDNYIEFLDLLIAKREKPLILLADHASFHRSKAVREFVFAHRNKLRVFFLPKRAPELNPDEQLWNEIKNNQIGKQPVKSKLDLKNRLTKALDSVQKNAKRIINFFRMPDTIYAFNDCT